MHWHAVTISQAVNNVLTKGKVQLEIYISPSVCKVISLSPPIFVLYPLNFILYIFLQMFIKPKKKKKGAKNKIIRIK